MSYIEYAWKSKGHKLDAQWFGRETEKIEKRDGSVTPRAVLEIARPKNSPAHGEFEWNDDVAGENWRIHQARQLIGHLHIVRVGEAEPKEPVRAFVNIAFAAAEPDEEKPTQSYYGIVEALADDTKRDLVLEKAKQDLASWRRRYAHLKEFADLIPVINRYLEAAE